MTETPKGIYRGRIPFPIRGNSMDFPWKALVQEATSEVQFYASARTIFLDFLPDLHCNPLKQDE